MEPPSRTRKYGDGRRRGAVYDGRCERKGRERHASLRAGSMRFFAIARFRIRRLRLRLKEPRRAGAYYIPSEWPHLCPFANDT